MRKFTNFEKKIAMALLMETIDRENFGFLSSRSAGVSMRDHMDFVESGWKIEYNKNLITFNGLPAYKIIRKYSSRKVDLCHKQLKPSLEFIG
jgi:hypothetical protein